MAGGKKKAARQKINKKYEKYQNSGRREQNKARRIFENLIEAQNVAETSWVVIERYAEVCKHPKADNVIANVKRNLSKRGITPKAPEKKEDV